MTYLVQLTAFKYCRTGLCIFYYYLDNNAMFVEVLTVANVLIVNLLAKLNDTLIGTVIETYYGCITNFQNQNMSKIVGLLNIFCNNKFYKANKIIIFARVTA